MSENQIDKMKSILIIEDRDLEILLTIKMIEGDIKYADEVNFLLAHNGKEALDLLKNLKETNRSDTFACGLKTNL